MSIVRTMTNNIMSQLDIWARGMWEVAFIFEKGIKVKQKYAKEKLEEIKESIDKVEQNRRFSISLKDTEDVYNIDIDLFDKFRKQIAELEKGTYGNVLKELDTIIPYLRKKYYEKQIERNYF